MKRIFIHIITNVDIILVKDTKYENYAKLLSFKNQVLNELVELLSTAAGTFLRYWKDQYIKRDRGSVAPRQYHPEGNRRGRRYRFLQSCAGQCYEAAFGTLIFTDCR